MNVFETIIFYLVFIVFPLTLWLLYQAYSKTMNKEKSNIFLDFALFSSMYLIVKFGIDQTTKLPILLFNVPLLIAYYKERHFSIIVLSILIINYYHYYLDFNLIILIIEYFIYYLLYLFIKIKKIKIETFVNIFVLIKLGFLVIKFIMSPNFISKIDCNNLEIIVIFVMFYLISHFVIYLFKTAEDILELHLKFCEIEHQKDITNSLFQITHEIKNPIAVCKGYLDMFDVNNVEHSKKYIPILKSEIDRLLLLLQDFLSINRINIDKDIINIALDRLKVDNMGLDETDHELLLAIIKKFNGGPVGIESIAASIGEEQTTIEDVIEPFLLQEGFIKRTPRGRVATEKSYKHLRIELPERK